MFSQRVLLNKLKNFWTTYTKSSAKQANENSPKVISKHGLLHKIFWLITWLILWIMESVTNDLVYHVWNQNMINNFCYYSPNQLLQINVIDLFWQSNQNLK